MDHSTVLWLNRVGIVLNTLAVFFMAPHLIGNSQLKTFENLLKVDWFFQIQNRVYLMLLKEKRVYLIFKILTLRIFEDILTEEDGPVEVNLLKILIPGYAWLGFLCFIFYLLINMFMVSLIYYINKPPEFYFQLLKSESVYNEIVPFFIFLCIQIFLAYIFCSILNYEISGNLTLNKKLPKPIKILFVILFVIFGIPIVFVALLCLLTTPVLLGVSFVLLSYISFNLQANEKVKSIITVTGIFSFILGTFLQILATFE